MGNAFSQNTAVIFANTRMEPGRRDEAIHAQKENRKAARVETALRFVKQPEVAGGLKRDTLLI